MVRVRKDLASFLLDVEIQQQHKSISFGSRIVVTFVCSSKKLQLYVKCTVFMMNTCLPSLHDRFLYRKVRYNALQLPVASLHYFLRYKLVCCSETLTVFYVYLKIVFAQNVTSLQQNIVLIASLLSTTFLITILLNQSLHTERKIRIVASLHSCSFV